MVFNPSFRRFALSFKGLGHSFFSMVKTGSIARSTCRDLTGGGFAMSDMRGLFFLFTLSLVLYGKLAFASAPIVGDWQYSLCQPLSYVSLSVKECEIWKEGEYYTQSGNSWCLHPATPFPWSDTSMFLPKSMAFYGDVSGELGSWLNEGETLPYNGCAYTRTVSAGVESKNVQPIKTYSDTGGQHSFFGIRNRTVTCGPGYQWSKGEQTCLLVGPDRAKPFQSRDRTERGPCPTDNGSNPIDSTTGFRYQTETDYRSAGALTFERYFSTNPYLEEGSVLGVNWHPRYSRHLKLISVPNNATVFAYKDTGQYLRIDKDFATGEWVSQPDVSERLLELTDTAGNTTGWQLVLKDGNTENYDAAGRLTSIEDRSGVTVTLTYDSSGQLATVEDVSGNQLVFSYDTEGRLASVTTPEGDIFQYAYDASNNLSVVTYPENSQRTYLYEDTRYPNFLTGILDANGDRYATWTYDDKGRATSSEHAGGSNKTTFDFISSGATTVTNALGKQTIYYFKVYQGLYKITKIKKLASANEVAVASTYTYNSQGFVIKKVNWNGSVTKYTRDAMGREISRIEAFGATFARTITTEWDPTRYLRTKVTEPERVTTYQYDDKGRLVSTTVESLQ